jgi:phosphoribosylglycinamide formyltransferase-1
MKKIVILFSGKGTNLQNLIEKLHKKKCIVAAAITNRPDAEGIAKAKAHGIPVEVIDHTRFESREAFDTELVKRINAYAPDLVVMAGFMRIVTSVFTDNVHAINLHPSLLPLFKGGNAIEENFESGETRGGVSVHWVSGDLDGGRIIAQQAVEKSPDETLESFAEKIHALEYDLLPETITRLLNEGE